MATFDLWPFWSYYFSGCTQWMDSWTDGCLPLPLAVCVSCLFVLVRACVHFMGYLQAQLTASVFLLPYCRLLTFGLRSRSSSRSSNARPTLRLLNLAVQRDLRTDEQGANRIRKLPSALGIFFFLPSVSILIPLLQLHFAWFVASLRAKATNSLPRAHTPFRLICPGKRHATNFVHILIAACPEKVCQSNQFRSCCGCSWPENIFYWA